MYYKYSGSIRVKIICGKREVTYTENIERYLGKTLKVNGRKLSKIWEGIIGWYVWSCSEDKIFK